MIQEPCRRVQLLQLVLAQATTTGAMMTLAACCICVALFICEAHCTVSAKFYLPFAPSSLLFLVVWPGSPSSVLAPSSDSLSS